MSELSGRSAISIPSMLLAGVLDVLFVVLFAATGRSQHGEVLGLAGVWGTAWPFLAGLVIIWVCGMVWRRPMAPLRSGVPVWLGTLAIGLLLRVGFTDGGAALPFVLVASAVLGLTLVGWRLLAALVVGISRRRRGSAGSSMA